MRSGIGLVAVLALGAIAVPVASDPPAPGVAMTAGSNGAAVDRVTLRFSARMVPLGQPLGAAPAAVRCPVPGEGRWADPQTWVWSFAHPLPGGASCRLVLHAGLKTLAGHPVSGPRDLAIDAGGPTARAILPGGDEIEEDQAFFVAVNGPVDRGSIAREAYCTVDGIGEKLPVALLPADTAARVLHHAGTEWARNDFLDAAGLPKPLPAGGPALARALSDVVALRCARPLPPGRDMSLVWPGSVRAPSGRVAGETKRFDFTVRAEFTAKWECSRVNPRAGCSPVEAGTVSFSAPVRRSDALAVRLDLGGGHVVKPVADGSDPTVSSVSFKPPLAAGAQATLLMPAGLRDESGRPLANGRRFPLPVRIDPAPPLIKFAAPFGILEAKEGGVLPVTVRAVEPRLAGGITGVGGGAVRVEAADGQIAEWMRRVAKMQEDDFREEKRGGGTITVNHTGDRSILPASGVRPISLALPGGGKPFTVIGMPLKQPGFYVVELKSPALGAALLGRPAPRYVAAAALVTNMAVHFKWGRGASLAWVTALDSGRPVAGAQVRVTNSCTGATLFTGNTDRWGRLPVVARLPDPTTGGSCDPDEEGSPPLMVSARAGGDYSFVLTSWGEGIQPYDFDLPFGYSAPDPILHAVLDRALVRAGETVNMTLVWRRPVARGFRSGGALNATLRFSHMGSDTSFDQPLHLDARGMGEASWTPPKGAPNGDYAIQLVQGENTTTLAQTIKVDEYRLPTMRASVSGPKAPAVRPGKLPVDLYLGYLSGGGAGGSAVTLRTAFEPLDDAPAGWDGWTFGGKRVEEGTVALDEDGDVPSAPLPPARTAPLTLGKGGALRTAIALPPIDGNARAIVEMDYPDANGETLTASARVPIYAADLRVGVKQDGWLQRQDALHLKLAALSPDGKPMAGKRINVQLFTRETISARRRLIGGFYAYDNSARTIRIGAHCSATTDAHGIAGCTLDPGVSGEVYAEATASDERGNVSRAVTSVWLVGDDDWWFGGDNGDRMDIVLDAKSYRAGDIAHVQVRMPFREATGLITVEREGVLASQVVHLSGRDPVVDVKLEPGWSPDVYISVMAVRGRIAGWRLWLADFARRWHIPWVSREGAAPTALVDLAKPSYRIGIAKVSVGWEAHRLDVAVRPDRTRYHVRDVAQVAVQVREPGGRAPREAEIAFAAVDEGLLTLAPNDSWALLDDMMAERPLSVTNATAQMQVVGKRHYGRKAVASGGGGGGDLSALTRSDFRPVLLWRGRVPLDAQGRAHVAVPLADALSAYKLVAVATAGADRFGTGQAEIRTVQELTLYPGVPPLVRAGDRFGAVFTLRNGTDRPMRVTAAASVSPAVVTGPPIAVTVPAGGAVPVTWWLIAPGPSGHLQWRVTARAADGRAADRVSVGQEIVPAIPVETWAATLLRIGPDTRVPVAAPAGALPGRSAVEVRLGASLAPPLDGVRAYMRAYPYDCLEQRLSRAVVLGDGPAWAKIAVDLPAYQAPDGLVRYFPGETLPGSAVLTSYVLSLTAEAGLPLPAAPKARMLGAMRAVLNGRLEDEGSGPEDRRLLRVAALAALARNGAATPAMLGQIGIAPAAMPTGVLADWIAAVDHIAGADPRLRAQGEAVLRSRIDYEGSRLDLVDRASAPWWMMASGDEMAVKALLAVVGRPDWAGEAPRMAVGVSLRQARGHWDTTTANAWGAVLARRLLASYPPPAIGGTTTLTLGATRVTRSWPQPAVAPPLVLPLRSPGSLLLTHSAQPGPWATVAVRAAVPLARPFFAGYRLQRSVSVVEQHHPGRLTRGDILRVHLVIDAGVDRTWVALSDPVPAGASVIAGQATQSGIVSNAVDLGSAGTLPAYTDAAPDAFRAYYAWLPRGRTVIDYALRLNGAGRFQLAPSTVEAMYSPEIRAAVPNAAVEVGAR